MKSYPAYKENGGIWFRKIPQHWSVGYLKFKLSNNDGGVWGNDAEEEGTIVLRSTEIRLDGSWRIDTPAIRELTDTEIKKALLKTGDLLITKSSGSEAHIGKTALVTSEVEELKACYSNFMQRIRPTDEMNSRFLHYFMNSSLAREQYNYQSTTTTGLANLNSEIIENLRVPFIPLTEQDAVANFLDRKTTQIDDLIAKKQRQIDLLHEQRTALINQAVTKGLNPDAPMKDSGVEWLGEIPSHWDVNIKLTMLAEDTRNSFVNGPFGSNLLVSELTESGVPVIYIKDVRNGIYKRKSTEHVTPEKALELDSCRVDPGDILIAKVGDPPGATAVYPDSESSGIVTQDVIRIKLKTSIVLPQYFALFLNSEAGRAVVGQVTIESTRSRIPLGDFKNVRIPLPPINEQIQIIERLSELLSQADKVAKISYNLIERLQEYRTALISAAVTGKIDVRGE